MGPAAVMTSTQEDQTSPVLISLRMIMQNIFEKCVETPSRGAIGFCSNIPNLKKDLRYNLMAMIKFQVLLFLPGPRRRRAPVLKCRLFFFSKLHCEGYIADSRYIAGSLLMGVLSAILESTRSTVKRKIFAF